MPLNGATDALIDKTQRAQFSRVVKIAAYEASIIRTIPQWFLISGVGTVVGFWKGKSE